MTHGLTLAKLLGASDLLLVQKTADGMLSFQRLGTQDEKLVSQIVIAAKSNADEISAAAQALATSRSGRIIASEAHTIERSHRESRSRHRGSLYGGIALATGSVATLTIGWVVYAQAMQLRDQVASRHACALGQGGVDVICPQSFAQYSTLGDLTPVFAVLGSTLGVAALPALLPEIKGVPVWSWIVGTAGAATAASGIALWSRGDRCSFSKCDPTRVDVSLGQMLLIDSAPLLAVPLTYAIPTARHAVAAERSLAAFQGLGGQTPRALRDRRAADPGDCLHPRCRMWQQSSLRYQPSASILQGLHQLPAGRDAPKCAFMKAPISSLACAASGTPAKPWNTCHMPSQTFSVTSTPALRALSANLIESSSKSSCVPTWIKIGGRP
jgi:hypothetical protein